jgi:inner membrane protein
MPSPIGHAVAGYAIYKICAVRYPERAAPRIGPVPRLLAATVGLSLLPDLDFLPGLLVGDFDRYHNAISHSLFFGVVVALLIGTLMWLIGRSHFLFWFGLTLLCYELHVIMDFFIDGRGVMLLWPLSPDRLKSPVKLFYGLHRSDGWVSIRHLWTLLTELVFAVFVILTMNSVIDKWMKKSIEVHDYGKVD